MIKKLLSTASKSVLWTILVFGIGCFQIGYFLLKDWFLGDFNINEFILSGVVIVICLGAILSVCLDVFYLPKMYKGQYYDGAIYAIAFLFIMLNLAAHFVMLHVKKEGIVDTPLDMAKTLLVLLIVSFMYTFIVKASMNYKIINTQK